MSQIEQLPEGWVTVETTFAHHDGREESRFEILDVRGIDLKEVDALMKGRVRYLHEPMLETAIKCALLCLVLPIYFAGYGGFHLLRTMIAPIRNGSPTLFCQQIWKLAKIPIYAVAMEWSTLYGCFYPLEGKSYLGLLQLGLHQKNRNDNIEISELPSVMWEALSAKEFSKTFFFPPCMLPIGLTSEPHIKTIKIVHPTPLGQDQTLQPV